MIVYRAGIWIADLPFAAKDDLKAAGFVFHGTECKRKPCPACAAAVFKKWWTDSAVVAARLPELLDPGARAALEAHREVIETSHAQDAELDIPAPPGLDYLPFQRAGIRYILDAPGGVLLGDEMGLGKTIQAIGYLQLEDVFTAVVVCPANLKINWVRELERWLVEPRNIHMVEKAEPPPANAEIVVVNYRRLLDRDVIEGLMAWSWDVLICDEAHNLKNPRAKQTRAVLGAPGNKRKKVEPTPGLINRCGRFLALTGTALLNRPIELWTLISALDPGGWPSKHQYGIRYCAGHQKRVGYDREKGQPRMAWDFNGASNLDELQDKLRGKCLVRRLKRDVLPELPAKRHEIISLNTRGVSALLKRQTKLWLDQGSARMHADLAMVLADDMDREAYEEAVARLDAELEIAFDKMSEERRLVAVAKIPAVIEHIQNLFENHDLRKLVVFAHHHEVIDALSEAFGDSVWIDGRVSPADRQDAVDIFQSTPCKMLIGGIRAAGEGITLTASSNVVFAELDWTPARNQQAEDRCHRIGQRDMVLIQHLVFDGSIDAMIAKLLVHKMRIADQVLDRR
jgi:SWI/SNF-related matrix-associated actin-dependent regulator 1 of chromatin subfamily A